MILPEAFVHRTKKILGEYYSDFLIALDQDTPISIRINNKINYNPSNLKVPWCELGFYLNKRPLFTADPLFHAGVYYVQEASSMFLEQIVKQHFPNALTVLDLCAAPGGKSTLLSQNLIENSLLVSNEINRSRAYILAENLIKWGNSNVVVTNNEPKDFAKLSGFFDAIVIDAPCSGEGMFRKDSGAINEWSEYNVNMCAARQRDIVSSVWDCLKHEGILVYSTCTFNTEENEENVKWICNELGAEVLKVDLQNLNTITTSDVGYRFYPHRVKGEGFYISVLRKTQIQNQNYKNKISGKQLRFNQIKIEYCNLSLINPDGWIIINENNLINAYNKDRINDYLLLNKLFKCIYSGLFIGEFKGKDFIPSANIALSKKLDHNSIIWVEVDINTAIKFLRKDAISFPDLSQGYILVCYHGLGLGWVKNLGNRCNNLYPHEWRIRMNIGN